MTYKRLPYTMIFETLRQDQIYDTKTICNRRQRCRESYVLYAFRKFFTKTVHMYTFVSVHDVFKVNFTYFLFRLTATFLSRVMSRENLTALPRKLQPPG